MWKHCKGSSNPADLSLRATTPTDLVKNTLWLEGPHWLYTAKESEATHNSSPPSGSLEELKKINTLLVSDKNHSVPILKSEDHSSLYRLLKVTVYVFKFIELLRSRGISPQLTADDIEEAQIYWIQISQQSLPEERLFKMWSSQFGLFMDEDGLWRCGGRLKNTNIPEATKHRILLDVRHHLTMLIVRDCHEVVNHGGVAETLAQLWSNYWIVRGRSFVRWLIFQCIVCLRFDGTPYRPPRSPALPESHVSEAPPFTFMGIDFAGPLYLKNSEDKLWICLFTCVVMRAVHLEVVTALSAQVFIRCFSRFTFRRGLPTVLISDNAKTFKSAKNTLESILKDKSVQGTS